MFYSMFISFYLFLIKIIFFFSSSTPKTLSDYTVSSFVNDYVFFKVQCFRFRLPLKELVGRQSITCLTADQ